MNAGGHKIKILIVEDNVLISDNFDEFLTDLGHEVVGVETSGEGAVETAKLKQPDLVLMDISLEGNINGKQAAELITRHDSSVKFVFMTGLADSETIKELGMFDNCRVMTKPVPCNDLQAVLKEFMQSGPGK